ncbi:glycosyltransferase family 4 protein [Marinobacter sp.]|uniref:glycosyltransferase family 4 protein n=1 Tax=Marinobacter sp. TaxID=50741 RepID=UPI0019C15F46|nr:glycosyltransferase family 4 protein [Marinobacter sp.]MBD3655380.1 glycosyltransferase family 4 protein [Marinobacter sp.]
MINLINIISAPKGGGAELLVRELHEIYTNRNLHVHAIYLDGNIEDLKENEVVLGVNPRSPLNVLRIRKLCKELSGRTKDELIVHAHLTWPFFYVALASLGLSNVRLIYTEHSTTNKRRKIPLLWVIERLLYARYTRIICISQGVYDSLANWVGPNISERLVTIPNGARIYSLAKRLPLEKRLPRLVSVGSLTSRKNFATAIHAIAQLRNEIDSYTIVGEGPERRDLEHIIESEQLEGKVKLIGWFDDIEVHLGAADIQLIPSLWEGFGLVAVEGMSTGLPVVASNVDGLREVLDESNSSVTFISQADSVQDWVSGISKAIADLHSRGAESLAQSSRQQAEKFTLAQMAERYLEIYQQ